MGARKCYTTRQSAVVSPPSVGRFIIMNGSNASNPLTIFVLNPVCRSTSSIKSCMWDSPPCTNSDLMVSAVFWIKARSALFPEWPPSAFRLLADETLLVILSLIKNSSAGINVPSLADTDSQKEETCVLEGNGVSGVHLKHSR